MSSSTQAIERLRGEPAARAQVRVEQGAPRLFVNDREMFPLLAWSWLLAPSTYHFKRSGITILHPILGLNAAWPEPNVLDWSLFEKHFDELLTQHPGAFFLPRVHLDVPEWWKDQNESELVATAIPPIPKNPRQYRAVRINPEGGMAWGIPLREVSLASERWHADLARVLEAFLGFINQSPLVSRVIGYQLAAGIYGEWHYPMSEFLPDSSAPVVEKIGDAPTAEQRLRAGNGLLRDPVEERSTISWYEKLHRDVTAAALLRFAAQVKELTSRRIIVGSFQTYLLENVWIQEGGHLAPKQILESPDIDFVASPYSYQTTNDPDRPWYEHDTYDDRGNYLGRARGIGGDAGYRVLLESLRRAGKLYFAEIDPSTYLEPHPDVAPDDEVVRELPLIGGVGSTTPSGTQDILRRDIGRLLVSGSGGWLFDFGPTMATGRSWYADELIIQTVRELFDLGEKRSKCDLSPVAEIAAIYDYRSFFYTRHWLAEAPFRRGMGNMDHFSAWYLQSQSRVLHRLGAPVDFLYYFDLRAEDLERYRVIIAPNLFYLEDDEIVSLRKMLAGSGVTVIWFYAPALISNHGLDPNRCSALMGLEVEFESEPGRLMVDLTDRPGSDTESGYGVDQEASPRLYVADESAEILGVWVDSGKPALARKSTEGKTSVFSGCAPIPIHTLRRLVADAGVRLWSSHDDIVVASQDAAMIVATSEGRRRLRLHRELRSEEDGQSGKEFNLEMREGEVRFFFEG